jgi:hypothetical protein
MNSEPKPNNAAVPVCCVVPEHVVAPRSVTDRIAAFLDGRTHGEELLHELYDYILEEPIPQRMRALLSKGGNEVSTE